LDSIWVRIAAGAFIPSLATIIFNLLNFFFENYQTRPMPAASASILDIASGCIFSIVGISVAVKDRAMESKLMVLTILLILVLLAGDFLVPAFFPVERLHMVVAMDAIAFCTLCLTIWKAG
jgi:hypothetical protein